jgi:hypothetical protein
MNPQVMETHELSILQRLTDPKNGTMSPEAAQGILDLSFSNDDQERMRALAGQAQEGNLSPDEQAEVAAYERIGSLLQLLQSKDRIFLKGSSS